jgi:hypothetical protein
MMAGSNRFGSFQLYRESLSLIHGAPRVTGSSEMRFGISLCEARKYLKQRCLEDVSHCVG